MNWEIGKIYNIIKKLTKEQKKIIYISVIVLVFLLIFWIFVYGPQARSFAAIKRKLQETESGITQIMSIAGGRDLAEAVRELKANLVKVTGKLPATEQVVIYSLSETARKLKIEVKNMTPSPKLLLEDKISGYSVEELSISMSLVSNYRLMGEYLHILRSTFPVLIRVRHLGIKGKGEGRTDLDVSLQISAYLSREKK